jgi:hypothetical protein
MVMMKKGEFATFEHYRLPKGKAKGTRSIP